MHKDITAYKTIGEVAKILEKKNEKNKKISPTTIRFWEKNFRQLKPKVLNNNRRYYDENNVRLLKKIYFLLKEQGMTIKGAKKILNNDNSLKLDESTNRSINAYNLKKKLIKISNIVKSLKDK
tara:strand:+ start:286 stop:654 length:369 start_codon:yes stop_codon:yes gene_type:complete